MVVDNDADDDGICDDDEQPDVCDEPTADINEPQTVMGVHDRRKSARRQLCGAGDEDVINSADGNRNLLS